LSIDTLTVAGADEPTALVAITEKLAGVMAPTGGAVHVTEAPVPETGVNVPAGPEACVHWKLIGVAPLATAFKVMVPLEATWLLLGVADVITGGFGAVTVTFSVAVAIPPPLVAVTVSVTAVSAATIGAVHVGAAAVEDGANVPPAPPSDHAKVMGAEPVAVAASVMLAPDATVRLLAEAVTAGGVMAHALAGVGIPGHGFN
jgi:hypothetical protein